jgi:hypothetical protein
MLNHSFLVEQGNPCAPPTNPLTKKQQRHAFTLTRAWNVKVKLDDASIIVYTALQDGTASNLYNGHGFLLFYSPMMLKWL